MSSQTLKLRSRKKKSSRNIRPALVLLVGLGLLFGGLFTITMTMLPRDANIVSGVHVGSIAVGGMTRAKARQTLERALTRDEEITLTAGSQQRTVALSDLGIAPNADKLVKQAYQIGRQGSFFSTCYQLLLVHTKGVTLKPVYAVDTAQAENVLNDLGDAVNTPPADATARWDANAERVVLTPGHEGARLDVPASLKLIKGIANNELAAGRPAPATLALPYRVKMPHVNADMLAQVDTVLGAFSTSYATSTRSRGTNIETAAQSIDGMVMLPGEVFSFNKTVGPRNSENGFKLAPVIIDGQLQEGTGGGVCQVSTTLYNAVLLSDLKVTSRRHHSMPSHYVSAGRDATVVYGAIDFRFRNTTDAPIVLQATTANRRLTVRVLGKGPAPVVHIVTGDRTPRPGHTITKNDPSLPAGTRVVKKGKGGVAVTVSRVVGEGPDAHSEVISHDSYAGEPTIVRVGTGQTTSPVENVTDSVPAGVAGD